MQLPPLIKKISNIHFIRFLFVAGINTLFGYLLFAITVFLLKNVYLSVVLSTIIAVLFNFKTYGAIVFRSHDNSKIFRFFGVYLCTMSVQMILLRAFALAGITNPYIAGGIIILPVALLSFMLMRKFVFHTRTLAKKIG
jgi:putative flippase GtrA